MQMMKIVKKRGLYRVSERYKGAKEEDPVLVSLKFKSDVSTVPETSS